jgi:putative hydrolase of the HAD superfamily
VKAVLCDFSGTLFDDRSAIAPAALAARCAARGRRMSLVEASAVRAAILARVAAADGRAARVGCDQDSDRHRAVWTGLAASAAGSDRVVAAAFYDCLTDPHSWRPYPDAGPTLAALRDRGIAVAVVSNTGWDIRGSFAVAGLAAYVDCYVLSCELGAEKPDSAVFLTACQRLGVVPGRALMVGDDPASDGGAAAAGLATYLLPADRRVDRPRGLARILPLCA